MKVYEFVRQLVYKYDDDGIETDLYATREEAQEAFDKWKRQRLEDFKCLVGWTVETDEPDAFEVFLEGDWCNNHFCGYIREFEL